MGNEDVYYDELAADADPARQVGWRHRIEQAYRFEIALEVVEGSGTVLDIGCGRMAFADYSKLRGHSFEVVGLDRRVEFVKSADHVVQGDFRTPPELPQFDSAVAIGALTGSDASEATLRSFAVLCDRSRKALCVVQPDERVVSRAAMAADPAIVAIDEEGWGVFERALQRWRLMRFRVTTIDSAVVGGRNAAPVVRSVLDRFRATCEGPWGRDEPPSRHAWLAVELGLVDEARRIVASDEARDELGEIVRQRLTLIAKTRSTGPGATEP